MNYPIRSTTPFLLSLPISLLCLGAPEAFAASDQEDPPSSRVQSQRSAAQIRAALDRRAQAVTQRRPEFARTVAAIEPAPTRTGALAFRDPRLRDPDAAALLLQRSRSSADPEFRRAVASALASTGVSTLAALVLEQFQIEESPLVRRSLAFALRSARDEAVVKAMQQAMQDREAMVRRSALDSMRFHPQPEQWGPMIVSAIADRSELVRIAAIRAWGTLRNPALQVDILPLIKDADATLRRAALRAFSRVYPHQVSALVREHGLDRDPDARTAALARRLK